jgi:ABC-type hemin transport system ATPase subunit
MIRAAWVISGRDRARRIPRILCQLDDAIEEHAALLIDEIEPAIV